jgi:hypothetical protein
LDVFQTFHHWMIKFVKRKIYNQTQSPAPQDSELFNTKQSRYRPGVAQRVPGS